MRITILSSGSRGDVQPYVALGQGLIAAGYEVTLAAHAPFERFITEHGVGFAPLSGDPQALLDTPEGKRLLEEGDVPAKFFKRYAKLCEAQTNQLTRECYAVCQNADAIICTTNIFFIGEMVAEKLRKPLFYASLVPFAPSRKQPGMGSRKLPWWSAWLLVPFWHYHTMSVIGMQYFTGCFVEQVNRARQEVLGLPPRPRWFSLRTFRDGPPFLYNYSQHVYPRPSDWSETQHVTGYWFLDRTPEWQPPSRLVDFLQAGPPPVCIGFGSMTPNSPEELTRLVVQAVRKSGQRGILLTGWGGLTSAELGDDLFVIDAVPHYWLFPRTSAVVHHGGSGTTAAGLRAGKPTVVVPFLGDQPFWGRCVEVLGAGTVIPKKKLSADTLADAISAAVRDDRMQRRAQEVSLKLRTEDGVQTAVGVIERYLEGWFGPRFRDRKSTYSSGSIVDAPNSALSSATQSVSS